MKPTRTYYVLATVGLIWNLLGVVALVGQLALSEAAMADLPEAERALYETIPAWVTAAFAIAVIGGVLGCVLLLMRRRAAFAVLVFSLAAVFVQLSFYLVLSDALQILGASALVQPIIVTAVGSVLIALSIHARRRQWLR